METWPEACFKAYDIRGLANGDGTGELTPDFAYRLGRALATYLECDSFAVGRDIRDSSPALATQLMAGLADGGVEVWDLGIVSTGCVYHACWTLPVNGGVMVTASHLPMPTHNGFKMCRGTLPLAGEEIQELKDVFLKGDFREGAGEVVDHPHMDAYLDAIIASTVSAVVNWYAWPMPSASSASSRVEVNDWLSSFLLVASAIGGPALSFETNSSTTVSSSLRGTTRLTRPIS